MTPYCATTGASHAYTVIATPSTGACSILDPPDHTRIRSLVSKAFTPRSVAELQPRIRQIVDDLLDAVGDRDRFDLIEAFAYPLPVIVIAEMLGVPAQDRDRFKFWSNDVALTVEPTVSDEQAALIKRSSEDLIDYFDSIIDLRRSDPRDDLITALIAAEEEGDPAHPRGVDCDAAPTAGRRQRDHPET